MKIPRIIPIFAIVIISVFLTSCAGGQIATDWPGLAADQNFAYLAGGSEIYAVRVSDGSMAWKYPEKPDAKISFYASPVITSDGQLLAAGFNNVLYSLNPQNGQLNWSYQGPKDRLVAKPAVTDQAIYVPSADSRLYSLDLKGAERWKFSTGHALWSTPLVDGDAVVFGSMDHSVYAVNSSSGQKIWQADLGASIVGSPALSQDGKQLFIGTVANEMIALDAAAGTVVWRVPTQGGIWSGPAVSQDTLYFGDLSGNFYAMDAANGQIRWKNQPDGPIVGTPLVTDKAVVFGTEAGTLVALDLNGGVLWNREIGGKLYTSPVLAGDRYLVAPMGAEGKLLVALDQNGNQVWTFTPPK